MGTSTYSRRDLLRLLVDLITHHCTVKDLKVVVRAGVNTNAIFRKGLRPLHYAAYEDDVDIVTYLIDETGANVDVEDDLGYTPLHIACKHGNYKTTVALLKRNALVNFLGDHRSCETARALASLTINPLSLAIENNNDTCVEALLKFGADANQKYFLGHEVNLVPMENTRCLELLLEHGADPNVFSRGGLSPLMKACKNKQIDAVKVLLKHRADVNLQCPPKFDQKTALHFAASTGEADIGRCLLEADAGTSRPNNFDHSPLEYAIFADKLDFVETLLKYGADPNEPNEERCTALQFTVSTMGLNNRKAMTEVLLQYGANPNHHSQYFSYMGPSLSALVEYFSYMEDYDINLVRLLLAYGSCVNMTRPTRLLKIRDHCGILGQIRKLRPYEEIFDLLIDASVKFDLESIQKESSLSNKQQQILLEVGSVPRDLRHLARCRIRELVARPLPENLQTLPLPPFLRNYLLFNVDLEL